jgi:hypothetical protein
MRLYGMSIKQIVIVAILGTSSVAFADAKAGADNQRMWTLQAAQMRAEKGNLENKKVVTDAGVLVTAQRDPHQTKSSPTTTAPTTTTAQQ